MVIQTVKGHAEIRVAVVGPTGVGKTTLMQQLDATQCKYESRYDFRNEYILKAYCSLLPKAPKELVRFVFKEIDPKRMSIQPLEELFQDQIVILVYNAGDERTFKDALVYARLIQVLSPETIFFLLGNKGNSDSQCTVLTEHDIPSHIREESVTDRIKLHLLARSFKSEEFLNTFLDSFMKICYHKSCADRGFAVGNPETVLVSLTPPSIFSVASSRCSIL